MNEMKLVRRLFVEKREEFSIESKEILKDLQINLGIKNLKRIRLLNRYDISGISRMSSKRRFRLFFQNPL